MFRRLIVAVCLVAISGCATSTRPGPDSSVQVAGTPKLLAGQDLPMPGRPDPLTGDRAYFVGPYDTLTIDVFGIEEMKARDVQVDAGGQISFPLAGTIKVTGMSPAEIRAVLEQRLTANYVRNPQVTVNVKEIVSQVVTVEGQVRKPGQFPVIGRTTLLRAIAQAEGTDEYSKLSDVVIFRTVDGQQLAALYDLRAIRRGNYRDPEIFANDVVVVGDSKGRRLFKDFLGLVPLLTTPLVVLLQR